MVAAVAGPGRARVRGAGDGSAGGHWGRWHAVGDDAGVAGDVSGRHRWHDRMDGSHRAAGRVRGVVPRPPQERVVVRAPPTEAGRQCRMKMVPACWNTRDLTDHLIWRCPHGRGYL